MMELAVNNDPTRIITDAEKAAGFKSKLDPLLAQVAAIIDEANKEGFIVNIAINKDQYGRNKSDSTILKIY